MPRVQRKIKSGLYRIAVVDVASDGDISLPDCLVLQQYPLVDGGVRLKILQRRVGDNDERDARRRSTD